MIGSTMIARNTSWAFLFGGVLDTETDDSIVGHFYQDAFIFNIDTMKWFAMELKPMKDEVMLPKKKLEKSSSRSQKHQTV